MRSRCVDHDEVVAVRGSGLDCSTDDHLDDNDEQALGFRLQETRTGTARDRRKRVIGRDINMGLFWGQCRG